MMKNNKKISENDIDAFFEESHKEDRRNRISVTFFIISFATIVLLFLTNGFLAIYYHFISEDPELLDWQFRIIMLIFILIIVHFISWGWLEERKVNFSKHRSTKTLSMVKNRQPNAPFTERIFDSKNILILGLLSANTVGIVPLLGSSDPAFWIIYSIVMISFLIIAFYKSRRTLIVKKDEIIFYDGPDLFYRLGYSGKKISGDRIIGIVPRSVPVGEYFIPGIIVGKHGIRLVKTGIQIIYTINRTDSILTTKPLIIKSMFEGKEPNMRRV